MHHGTFTELREGRSLGVTDVSEPENQPLHIDLEVKYPIRIKIF